MTYADALNYLGQCRRFGMKLGLGSMRAVARSLGDPQERLRFIHLAGTNGKGSTAAFCESGLRAAGYRAGLYTSPHLVSVRERIQLDRVPISESDFALGIAAVCAAVEKMDDGGITFFEVMTALALWYFAREKADWVVWETGLGGRLDATNIVTPASCIITNIGFEHQQFLGKSLGEIATEKAGIIKPGVPVISAVEEGEARTVIEARAAASGCTLTLIPRDVPVENGGLCGNAQSARIGDREMKIGLLGSHQTLNAACALAALKSLGVAAEAVATGLEHTEWPGRFEIVSERPLIILDGAHNAAGIRVLVETWRLFLHARFGWSAAEITGRARIVFAAAADKDVTAMALLLGPLAREILLVRLAHERGADPLQLVAAFGDRPCSIHNSAAAAWSEVVTGPGSSVVLVTGSLFLVGEMLARRQGNSEEYRLNERLEILPVAR